MSTHARGLLRAGWLLLPLLLGPAGPACMPAAARSFSVTLTRGDGSPKDAAVYIDERFVGLLGVIAARGVRLPAGTHRVTVERKGYFPWDRLVAGNDQLVHLDVQLVRIPD